MTGAAPAPVSDTGYCGQCGVPAIIKGSGLCYDHATYDQMMDVARAMHAQIFAVMHGKDRHEALRALTANAKGHQREFEEAQALTPGLEDAVTKAVEAERHAADADRRAAQHASKRARELRRAERDGCGADTHDQLSYLGVAPLKGALTSSFA